jgi:hypothetical protein
MRKFAIQYKKYALYCAFLHFNKSDTEICQMNVRFSDRALSSIYVFPSFVVITAWVTLLYVVGLAGDIGRHKHWSDRGGELLNYYT